MIEVQLTQGKVALIDEADAKMVLRWRWYAVKHEGPRWYARHAYTRGSRPAGIYLHRLILGVGPGESVDHVDGDGLNNRRINLRRCSLSENNANQRKTRGASQFKGVFLCKRTGKWRAAIRKDNQWRGLGYFGNEVDAAVAYNMAARVLFGEYANLNEIH